MLPEVRAEVLAAHDLHALVLQHRRAPLYAALAAQLLRQLFHRVLGEEVLDGALHCLGLLVLRWQAFKLLRCLHDAL